MPSRHRSRQRALQVLFQIDMGKQLAGEAIRAYYYTLLAAGHEEEGEEPDTGPDPFMEELVNGTMSRLESLDRRIAEHSQNWRVERMPAVDRNLLRLAVYEMISRTTPPAVVINEALELARRFSGDESVPFINGILDTIRRQEPGLSGEPGAPE